MGSGSCPFNGNRGMQRDAGSDQLKRYMRPTLGVGRAGSHLRSALRVLGFGGIYAESVPRWLSNRTAGNTARFFWSPTVRCTPASGQSSNPVRTRGRRPGFPWSSVFAVTVKSGYVAPVGLLLGVLMLVRRRWGRIGRRAGAGVAVASVVRCRSSPLRRRQVRMVVLDHWGDTQWSRRD